MTVNVLGTKYSIHYKSPSEDKFLRECDGYCDKSSKRIVVTTKNIDLDNFAEYQKKCLRHELVHAFMYESGLAENWEHKNFGQEETVVDWVAIQFPKLLEIFKKAVEWSLEKMFFKSSLSGAVVFIMDDNR